MEKHLQNVINASPDAEIIIADDMSSDGSVAYIKKNFHTVKVVERSKREGFGANVNSGVARASGDVIILLNTDVEPEMGYLKPLISHFSDPDVFAVGCLEKSLENGREVLRGRGIAKWERGFYIHQRGEIDKADTAWVSGGSGAFRKIMWDRLGGMDTLYNPFYWEDIDLSYRARKSGWKTLFEAKSIVHHYHEEGKIKREFTPEAVKRIAYRNQFVFIWKNVTDPGILFVHALWTPIRLVQALIRGDALMFEGYILAVLRMFGIIAHRYTILPLFHKRDADLELQE